MTWSDFRRSLPRSQGSVYILPRPLHSKTCNLVSTFLFIAFSVLKYVWYTFLQNDFLCCTRCPCRVGFQCYTLGRSFQYLFFQYRPQHLVLEQSSGAIPILHCKELPYYLHCKVLISSSMVHRRLPHILTSRPPTKIPPTLEVLRERSSRWIAPHSGTDRQ